MAWRYCPNRSGGLPTEWIFASLQDKGFDVRCIETRHAQCFLSTRPNKTDRNDAEGIAQMMRLGHFKPVHVKSRIAQGVQTIVAARAQIVSTMVKLEMTARGLIKKFGYKISRGGRVSFAERVRAAISTDADLCLAIHPLLDCREHLRQQKLAYDRTLYAMSKRNDVCRASNLALEIAFEDHLTPDDCAHMATYLSLSTPPAKA